jgi:hypothetical protein
LTTLRSVSPIARSPATSAFVTAAGSAFDLKFGGQQRAQAGFVDGREAFRRRGAHGFLSAAEAAVKDQAESRGAVRTPGGARAEDPDILERLYRDARSGPFHPLTTDQALELLGRKALEA